MSALFLGLSALAAAPASAPAQESYSDRVKLCENDSAQPNQQLAACASLVASGRFTGSSLATLLALRGNAYTRVGANDRAIADFNQSLQLNRAQFSAYYGRGRVKLNQGDGQGAVADFTEAIKLKPDYALAYFDRARGQVMLKAYASAIDDFNACIRIAPSLGTAYFNRGIVYSMRLDYERALQDFTQTIRLNPDNVQAYAQRGEIYLTREKNWDRAIADFTQVIVRDQGNAAVYRKRAEAHYQKKDFDLAIADLDSAIRLDPADANTYSKRGSMKTMQRTRLGEATVDFGMYEYIRARELLASGDAVSAIEHFSTVLKYDPDNPRALYGRGLARKAKGDAAGAAADMAKATSLKPDLERE